MKKKNEFFAIIEFFLYERKQKFWWALMSWETSALFFTASWLFKYVKPMEVKEIFKNVTKCNKMSQNVSKCQGGINIKAESVYAL